MHPGPSSEHNKKIQELEAQLLDAHTALLEEKEAQHEREIAGLQESIAKLKEEAEAELKKFKEEIEALTERVARMERTMKIQRSKMVCGSIAFNFADRVFTKVWGKNRKLRRELLTLDDMREAPKDDAQKKRWEEVEELLTEELESAWEKLRNGRMDDAHPTTLTDDDDEVPTPDQLKQVLKVAFNSSSSANMRRQAENLIDLLDQLSRAQHVDILQ
jgi:hypothetical protein